MCKSNVVSMMSNCKLASAKANALMVCCSHSQATTLITRCSSIIRENVGLEPSSLEMCAVDLDGTRCRSPAGECLQIPFWPNGPSIGVALLRRVLFLVLGEAIAGASWDRKSNYANFVPQIFIFFKTAVNIRTYSQIFAYKFI